MTDEVPQGLDEFISQPAQSSVPSQPSSDGAPPGLDEFVGPEIEEEQYTTPFQKFVAGVEGAGNTATLGLYTKAEQLLNVPNEEIEKRRKYNENDVLGYGGGQALGLIVPALLTDGMSALAKGGAGAIAEAGDVAANAAANLSERLGLGAIPAGAAQGAARGAAEMAVFQAGDEASKHFLDPNRTMQTAVSNVGMASLMGGAGGALFGVVPPIWKAANESESAQLLSDFKNRAIQRAELPSPAEAITTELQNLHDSVLEGSQDIYRNLKAQQIEKHLPVLDEKMMSRATDLSSDVLDKLNEMHASPDDYPKHLANTLQKEWENFQQNINGADTSAKLFDAMNDFKQRIGEYAEFKTQIDKTDLRSRFVNDMRSLHSELKTTLENPDIWGKAADAQAATNKAFAEFNDTLKNFRSKFAQRVGLDRNDFQIDPGKVNTFLNQMGKPNAELKKEFLENFIDKAEKYRDQIASVQSDLGIENPIAPVSLNATKAMSGELTPGAKLFDYLASKGMTKLSGEAIGAWLGHKSGIPGGEILGYLFGKSVANPVFGKIIPAMARALLNSTESGPGFKAAMDVGDEFLKGRSIVDRAAKGVMKPGAEVLANHLIPDDKDLSKLDKSLEDLNQNPDKMMAIGSDMQHYIPDHAVALSQVIARAKDYLNSVKPKSEQTMPLDDHFPPSKEAESLYQRALSLVQQPVLLLKHLKDGTILPSDIKVVGSVYPDLLEHFREKMFDMMINKSSKDEPIAYKIRMGMSILMAQPLDSTMTPQAIQLTQMAAPPPMQPQQQMPASKGKSLAAVNKLSNRYMTPGQAAEANNVRE